MISRRVKILGQCAANTELLFDSPCVGCKQYCQKQLKISFPTSLLSLQSEALPLKTLPAKGHLEFSMSIRSQCLLLLNSLLLPLLGFILGAVIAEGFKFAEGQVIVSSLIGLFTGILFCRKFSLRKLNIKEVV